MSTGNLMEVLSPQKTLHYVKLTTTKEKEGETETRTVPISQANSCHHNRVCCVHTYMRYIHACVCRSKKAGEACQVSCSVTVRLILLRQALSADLRWALSVDLRLVRRPCSLLPPTELGLQPDFPWVMEIGSQVLTFFMASIFTHWAISPAHHWILIFLYIALSGCPVDFQCLI